MMGRPPAGGGDAGAVQPASGREQWWAVVVEDPAKVVAADPAGGGWQVGELYSSGTSTATDAELAARGLSRVQISEQPSDRKVWDRTTRALVDAAPRATREEAVTADLATDAEYQAMTPE